MCAQFAACLGWVALQENAVKHVPSDPAHLELAAGGLAWDF